MNFISSSQDIFFLVLAFCILGLTIFLAWMMYYAISAVKQVYEMISQLKQKLNAIDELVTLIKEKFNSSASYLSFIVSGVGKLITLLSNKESSPKKSKR
jgi:CHASE3 domain sensor protein